MAGVHLSSFIIINFFNSFIISVCVFVHVRDGGERGREMERERQRKRGRCLQVSTSHDTESMLRAEDNCGVGPTFRWGIEQRSLPLHNKHSY